MPNSKRINIKNIKILSDNHFILKRYEFEYMRKDGTKQLQMREVYDCGDAVAALIYNREKQTVILVKQFRMPCFVNGNLDALLEVPAGLLDGMEPSKRIIEELKEETGYQVENLEKIYEGFACPGALTQKVHFFVGEYQDKDKTSLGGGIVDEGEEIEILEMSFSKALELLKNNQIQDMKTIMLLQYAQLKIFN